MDSEEMREVLNDLLEDFEELKRVIKDNDRLTYERWKAGGFLVDSNILSDYPNIEKAVEIVSGKMEEKEMDEYDDEYGDEDSEGG